MQKIANNTSTIFIEINETVIKEMIDLYYEKERQPNYEQMWKELKKEPALNYLAEINLITRRSYRELDSALMKARQIRSRKG